MEWELITCNEVETTQRIPAEGGYVWRTIISAPNGDVTVAMCYVPGTGK